MLTCIFQNRYPQNLFLPISSINKIKFTCPEKQVIKRTNEPPEQASKQTTKTSKQTNKTNKNKQTNKLYQHSEQQIDIYIDILYNKLYRYSVQQIISTFCTTNYIDILYNKLYRHSVSKRNSTTFVSDPCVNSPCFEGATCVSLTNVLRPLYCSCPLGRTGDLCQHVGGKGVRAMMVTMMMMMMMKTATLS